MTTYRRIIGIDPSLTATGLAHADGTTETITYPRGITGDARLGELAREIEPLARHGVDLAVIEDLPTHAHGAGLTGMAQGAIRLTLQQRGIPYAVVPPASLKKLATGKGNATKADMRMAWFKRTGEDIRDDNQVDAAWLRMCGMVAVDHLDALELPKPQREALLKVRWPEDIAAALLEPYERVGEATA